MPYCVVFIRYVDKLELCAVCGFCFHVFLSSKVRVKCQHFTINDSQQMKWILVYD